MTVTGRLHVAAFSRPTGACKAGLWDWGLPAAGHLAMTVGIKPVNKVDSSQQTPQNEPCGILTFEQACKRAPVQVEAATGCVGCFKGSSTSPVWRGSMMLQDLHHVPASSSSLRCQLQWRAIYAQSTAARDREAPHSGHVATATAAALRAPGRGLDLLLVRSETWGRQSGVFCLVCQGPGGRACSGDLQPLPFFTGSPPFSGAQA